MAPLKTLGGGPSSEHHGHTGWPVDVEDALHRISKGLPVYWPADPSTVDQRPYREFAGSRGPNSA